jgi:hypothetical protein
MGSLQAVPKVYNSIFQSVHDFAHLKRLDLRDLPLSYSFKPLMGKVPNLKSLEFFFGIDDPIRTRGVERFNDPTIIRDFILSIVALETLKITNVESKFDILWPGIVKHRDSLRTLSIHTRPDTSYRRKEPPILTSEQIAELQQTSLTNLEFDVLIPDLVWVRYL